MFDIALLEPRTYSAVAEILHAMGIELMVFETYRSQARQHELFAAGASEIAEVGVHHYGLACDLVRKVAGGPSWKGDFTFLGKLAKRYGLVWGGD